MTTLGTRITATPGASRCSREPGCASLAQTVQAAARAMDRNLLRPMVPQDAARSCQPATLLTVLAYCYALQIYGSAEIEALLRQDVNLRGICHQFPNARVIRRFRRENRESLQVCLEAALHFIASQKMAQGIISRVNNTTIAEEARRRIVMAMFTDSMELDKDQTTDTPTDLCYLIAKEQSPMH